MQHEHELDRYVRKNATYRLHAWNGLNKWMALSAFVSLLLMFGLSAHPVYQSYTYIGTVGLLFSLGMVSVCAVKYTKEWFRIADQHPVWEEKQ